MFNLSAPPASPPEPSEPPAPYAWAVLFVLTCLSGIFSGLNLGLMSLTVEDLNIVINSSSDAQQIRDAKRILPLRKRGNMLLCTLLIGNTVVNVMLSVLTDPIWVWIFGSGLVGSILSLALPSALIVVCGEIVPQSVCSRYALRIGAKTLPLTYCFVVVTFVFAFPISLLLDLLLGEEISGVYTRQGLIELIKLNVNSAAHAKESGLTTDDARLLGGALTFKDRSVGEVMTPLRSLFSVSMETVLDQETFLKILAKGHTRVPVYEGRKDNIVEMLLVKNLLGIGFERKLPLRYVLESFQKSKEKGGGYRVLRVSRTTKLNVALDLCKRNHVHMLVVTEDAEVSLGPGADAAAGRRRTVSPAMGTGAAIGVATVEDFLEEILQEEIVDETDVYVDNNTPEDPSQNLDTHAFEIETVIEDRPGARPVAGSGGSRRGGSSSKRPMKIARLNSKHIDTTIVLRQLASEPPHKGQEKSPTYMNAVRGRGPGLGYMRT